MKDDKQQDENLPAYTGKTYAFISAGLCAAAAVALGLSFTLLGVYSLIASVILSIASLSFLNVQKRKYNFKNLIIIRITALTVLGIAVAIFIGGIIWSAVK